MKKIVALIIAVMLILSAFSGCGKIAVSKEPLDIRFTAAHDEYVCDGYWIEDIYIPNNYIMHCSDKYEVQYRITYEDESQRIAWLEVDKEEYSKARDKLP